MDRQGTETSWDEALTDGQRTEKSWHEALTDGQQTEKSWHEALTDFDGRRTREHSLDPYSESE